MQPRGFIREVIEDHIDNMLRVARYRPLGRELATRRVREALVSRECYAGINSVIYK